MSAPDSLAGALTFTAQRFVAIATELDQARAKLAAVEAALLTGGQSAEVRCRAALVALGCDGAANNISAAECHPAIEYRSDPHIIVNPEGDQRELARAQETIANANALRAQATTKAGEDIPADIQPDESAFFCPRDHGCSLPAGHDGDCELTAALCFCDECEAKL